MRLTIDLSPQLSARLTEAARSRGVDPAELVESIVTDNLPPLAEAAIVKPVIDAENAAAIAWLEQRMAEDATDDPEEIRKADEEVAELRRNLNANRAATGERLVSL
jgi:hypothetical protein